jgi:hypothetical protein
MSSTIWTVIGVVFVIVWIVLGIEAWRTPLTPKDDDKV